VKEQFWLRDQLYSMPCNQFNGPLSSRLRSRLGDPLYSRLGDQLYSQLREDLKKR